MKKRKPVITAPRPTVKVSKDEPGDLPLPIEDYTHSQKYLEQTFKPSKKQRKQVIICLGFGMNQEDVATVIGISNKCFRRHFKDEIKMAIPEINSKLLNLCFQACSKGNTSLLIFALKNRLKWTDKWESTSKVSATQLNKILFEVGQTVNRYIKDEPGRIACAEAIRKLREELGEDCD